MYPLCLLFPCDFYDKSKVEHDYENEYTIAKSLGIDCALLDYDMLIRDEVLKTNISPNKAVIYRGWMLNLKHYSLLASKLGIESKCYLLTTPESYRFCHYFSDIYYYIRNYTPKTMIISDYKKFVDAGFSQLKENFSGYFMMKDDVKSVKGFNFPVKISVDISREEFKNLVEKFIELRGDLFTGNILLKQYVNLKKYGDTTNEIRVVYFFGEPISVTKNSNQPDNSDVPVGNILVMPSIKDIRSDYFVIDFAQLQTGAWTIIETGDGQVSGLSPNQNILEYYSKIQHIYDIQSLIGHLRI
jgi:hypothetical protein